jgi:hypothetical protein
VTYGCPIATRDGHDFPWLLDERVPGVAAVIDDVVEGFENPVRQPVLPHELPDIFLAVEFGCAWRELQERDVVWNLESLGAMPPGLIEEENSVSSPSDFGCDLCDTDLVIFVDAPSGDNVAKFALAVSSLGNVRTRTVRAWSADEYRKLISELP